jgi:hypothetical protein
MVLITCKEIEYDQQKKRSGDGGTREINCPYLSGDGNKLVDVPLLV